MHHGVEKALNLMDGLNETTMLRSVLFTYIFRSNIVSKKLNFSTLKIILYVLGLQKKTYNKASTNHEFNHIVTQYGTFSYSR